MKPRRIQRPHREVPYHEDGSEWDEFRDTPPPPENRWVAVHARGFAASLIAGGQLSPELVYALVAALPDARPPQHGTALPLREAWQSGKTTA